MDEQKQLKKFAEDMKELCMCADFMYEGDRITTIQCKLGLWKVTGIYGMPLINEAMHYFEQYKEDGEYSSIIGGKSIVEKLLENNT